MAGVYDYLPLGLKVLRKIENIVREEMNYLGGQEIQMTALQDSKNWKLTNRWEDESVDIWFKTELKNKTTLGLAFTHEEAITEMMRNHISSYNDLPIYVYQFQTKFRNELRAKSGLMRTREFLMKDLYSFCLDEKTHQDFYEKAKLSYLNIFNQVGIGESTFLTFASGGTFSKYSHEFQTVCDSGEDKIYLHREKRLAINEEVMNKEVLGDLALNKDDLEELKTVEVGNIFTLSDKFSEPLGLVFDNKDGQRKSVFMGSYGIGMGRLMAVVAEKLSDDKGLCWPVNIAPFSCHLVNLKNDQNISDKIYKALISSGVDVLYDDRKVSAGQKLKDSDLLGIPYQIILGNNFDQKQELELTNRKTGEKKYLKEKNLLNFLERELSASKIKN